MRIYRSPGCLHTVLALHGRAVREWQVHTNCRFVRNGMVALRKATQRQRCRSRLPLNTHGRTNRISIKLEAVLVKFQIVAEFINQLYIRCIRLNTQIDSPSYLGNSSSAILRKDTRFTSLDRAVLNLDRHSFANARKSQFDF